MAELVEGAPLLREYGVKNSIEGSNPSLSAIICLLPGFKLATGLSVGRYALANEA